MEPLQEIEQKNAVNRFASTLSGAFKAFHLYRQDNKAIDEIMKNLVSRYQIAADSQAVLKFGITNRSLVYDGESMGLKDLSFHLASILRKLGFKEIIFKSPIQGRHFFQLLNILCAKDPPEVMMEKLLPMISEEVDTPISLIPVASSSLLLRMSDEAIEKRLAPLSRSQLQGGPGLIELLMETHFDSLPDVYTWMCVKAGKLDKPLAQFVRNLTDAAREGYFPWERYLKVFPFPLSLKDVLFSKITTEPAVRHRRNTPLGLGFYPIGPRPKSPPPDWATLMSSVSKEDAKARHVFYVMGSQQSVLQDLDLAEALLKESGDTFNLGLRCLLRVLSQKNAVVIQERAVQLGIGIWIKTGPSSDDINLMSLISSLRACLASPHNLALTLFPLRGLTVESEMFGKLIHYLISLGEAALPGLINALNAEQDRGMRKKICLIITKIAKERGVDFLLDSMASAEPFLLRNIVMILGDVRNARAVPVLGALLPHAQKMIRLEAIRSLGKIATAESRQSLTRAILKLNDADEKKLAEDYLQVEKP